jgi:hypothetical protein
MKAAFIILAYHEPQLLARLAARLAPHHVFVHIDAKVDDEIYNQFSQLLSVLPHVKLIRRHRSAWASWGQVEAALEAMREAMQFDDWSHIMSLSGQCYPLVSASEIENFFSDHSGLSFVPHWHLPSSLWGKDGGMYRVRYWHKPLNRKRFFIPIPRKHPVGLVPVGGSTHWCLSRQMAEEVLSFTERRRDVVHFYQHVWAPDELYVPTVVMNSRYADSVINEALSYIRWSNPGSKHPDQLTAADAPELILAGRHGSDVGGTARRKLFARKVHTKDYVKLLDKLDMAAD